MVTQSRWFSVFQALSLRNTGASVLLAGVLVIAVSATFFTNNAGAQTLGQPVKQPVNVQVDCYNKLNGKNFRDPAQWNTELDQFFVKSCINNPSVGGNCIRDNANSTLACVSPLKQIADAQKAALKKTYGDALAAKQCSDVPAQGGQRQECESGFRNITNRCFDTFFANGYDDGSVTFPDIKEDVIANCIASNSSMPRAEAQLILKNTKDKATQDANKAKEDLESTNAPPPAPDGAVSTCRIEGVGWIVCPVTNFLAMIVDGAYVGVSALLTVPPLNINTDNNPLYSVWSSVRSVANVAFAIAFLFIIFSYITNVGVSNYGIKKMLPRLIIAAILVNISYWVCAVAVDLSNIIGSSVKSLVEGLNIPRQNDPSWWSWTATGLGSDNWQKLTGTLLAVGFVGGVAALAGGFAIFLPVILTALLAIATVFVVLIIRQALLILLIVVAPLAFVAYLLPNTENLFKKWLALFRTLLLMFPIIAAIFGLSRLAGQIIMNSSQNIFVQIAGAGVTIIPLVITPIVMRAAGGVLNRIGGFINNPNKGLFDRARKGAEGLRKNEVNRGKLRALSGNRGMGLGRVRNAFYRGSSLRKAASASTERLAGTAETQYVATAAKGSEAYRNRLAGGTSLNEADPANVSSALANAMLTIDEAEAKEVKAESVIVRDMDMSALTDIMNDSNASGAKKAAALDRMITIGDPVSIENGKDTGYARYVNAYGKDKSEDGAVIRSTMASALKENGPKSIKSSDLDAIRTGTMGQDTLESISKRNVANNVMSERKMASENNGNLQFEWDTADEAGKAQLQATAKQLLQNKNLSGDIQHNKAKIEEIANGGMPPSSSSAQPQPQPQQPTPPSSPPSQPQMNIPQNSDTRRFSGQNTSPSGLILPDDDRR